MQWVTGLAKNLTGNCGGHGHKQLDKVSIYPTLIRTVCMQNREQSRHTSLNYRAGVCVAEMSKSLTENTGIACFIALH